MKDQLDVTCYLIHFLCAQHVSDINISIIRSLRLCCWITTSVVLFSVCCVLELLSRLIFGGVRFAHNKWNKIASDIKLVFHSSTIAMMHGPVNIRWSGVLEWHIIVLDGPFFVRTAFVLIYSFIKTDAKDITTLKLHFFFMWRHSTDRFYAVPLLKFLDHTVRHTYIW